MVYMLMPSHNYSLINILPLLDTRFIQFDFGFCAKWKENDVLI